MDIVKCEDIYGLVPEFFGYPPLIPKIGVLPHTLIELDPDLRQYLRGFILIFLIISLVIDSS